MELYFLRHGSAGKKTDWEGDDAERPLTEAGVEQMHRVATTLASRCAPVVAVVTSPLVRAVQTAEIVAQHLGDAENLVRDKRLAPGFDVEKLRRLIAGYAGHEALMLVGHEPDFRRTIAEIVGGGRIVLAKGGLACVSLPDGSLKNAVLVSLLTPQLLGA